MKLLYSLIGIGALFLLAYAGVALLDLHYMFGVILPYLAIAVFIGGFIQRVVLWGKRPVPFRIPTSCGQQHTLPWIKSSRFDNPHTTFGVVGRMFLEVLLFRSLFRNTSTEVREGGQVVHKAEKLLWAGAMVFHWCFLLVVLRHMRFFLEPVPAFVGWITAFDGFLQIGIPGLLLTGVGLLASVSFLFLRRVYSPTLRYLSLPADYFPLFLIMGIAGSGLILRHFVKTDVTAIKELTMGIVSFSPSFAATSIHWLFYAHLLLVCVLLLYFPFSKLMHAGGVFLSPTRNMANNNRMVRHINPWGTPAHIHTYAEYEDAFREKMKGAGIPVEKE